MMHQYINMTSIIETFQEGDSSHSTYNHTVPDTHKFPLNARIRMRCEPMRCECELMRCKCARIACECAHNGHGRRPNNVCECSHDAWEMRSHAMRCECAHSHMLALYALASYANARMCSHNGRYALLMLQMKYTCMVCYRFRFNASWSMLRLY